MDAAAQLVYCGIDPLRRSSLPYRALSSSSSSSSSLSKKLKFRRRNVVVRAIATEPKPSEAKTTTKPVNGIPKPVNGSSTVGYTNSIFEIFGLI